MPDARSMRDARRKIDALMTRAKDHSTGIAESVLREGMLEFARKLKPECTLQYMAGMGTMCFRVKRPGRLPALWVTDSVDDDVYYDGDADTEYRWAGPRVHRFVQPLKDLVTFLHMLDNDHRLFTRDMNVAGTKRR